MIYNLMSKFININAIFSEGRFRMIKFVAELEMK